MVTTVNDKYRNTILYLCNELGGSLRGKKKLAKLLYFVDFDRYEFEESTKTVTGDSYSALPMGPVPRRFVSVIDDLKRKGALTVGLAENSGDYLPTEVYSCKQKPDMSVFDEDDQKILERVVRLYGGLSGKQLENLTHSEAPYIGTKLSEDIAFDLAFYRGSDFSDAMARTR